MADPFAASRDEARSRASRILHEHGFSSRGNGSFSGVLANGDEQVAVRLELPRRFPDEPPVVLLNDPSAISRRAHVEQNGKLCLFPNTGLLIDSARPEQIILDSLKRASFVLFGAEDDYKAEFLAYWRQGYGLKVLSCVSTLDRAHALAAATTAGDFLVVADSSGSLQEWLRRVGWLAIHHHNAFLVPLRELPNAPPFGSISSHGDLHKILRNYAADNDRAAFRSWLNTSGLPAIVVLSAPTSSGSERVVFAAEFRRAEGKAAVPLHKGFRPGKLPSALEVARSGDQPVVRIEPQRVDAEYVVSRVGGDMDLRDSSVVVVGCGSLGSQIAVNMAASGVGTITLVDHDQLSADNVHRHALGMSHIGEYKASALRDHLLARLPHLTIHAVPEEFEVAVSRRPELHRDQDLVILATGDETLERRFNTLFDPALRRVHGWLEPLGLGGHALLTGKSACYGCVFDRDDAGLHNLASLVQRGQDFLRSIGGCAGTFTPFGFVDAAQGALEVTRLALEVLRDKDAEPRLVSWIGATDQFRSAGYEISKRGEHALACGRIVDTQYGCRDCEVCRGS